MVLRYVDSVPSVRLSGASGTVTKGCMAPSHSRGICAVDEGALLVTPAFLALSTSRLVTVGWEGARCPGEAEGREVVKE